MIGEDGLRLNDGRCDRQGRFVVSEVDDTGRKRGRMFSTDGSLNPRPILDGINCGNSTCFRLDGTRMYFADTPERVIWEFDYDTDDGTPGNRRVFCDLHDQPGKPDGSIIDSDGCLWNAQWGGSRLVRYTPAGKVDRIVELPCRFPTCPAFGGSDLDTLYVTSARRDVPAAALVPADGAVLAVRTGCRGMAETLFCA